MIAPKPSQISYEVQAPVGGLNSRDSVRTLPESDALTLLNFFPRTSDIQTRRGWANHSTGMVDSIESIASLTEQDGTETLLAFGNSHIYNATTLNGTGSSLASGLSSDVWETCEFSGNLHMCNGADAPRMWNGTTLSTPAWTGVTTTTLADVTAFKSRLWFVERDSGSAWYGGIRANAGALTEFDLSGLLSGSLYAVETLSRQTGAGDTSQIVFISSVGDILIYDGDPTTTLSLVARAKMPRLLSRRSVFQYGQDLVFLTRSGVFSLSSLLSSPSALEISDKINNSLISDVESYESYAGWQVFFYPDGRQILINVPLSATNAKQYVINVERGSFAQYSGVPSLCWTIHKNKPYFGSAGGVVRQFDVGVSDGGTPISFEVTTAPLFFGDRATKKRVSRIQVMSTHTAEITLDCELRGLYETLGSETSVDYELVSTPWGSPWGSPWSSESGTTEGWESLANSGKGLLFRLSGASSTSSLTVSAFTFLVERGNSL